MPGSPTEIETTTDPSASIQELDSEILRLSHALSTKFEELTLLHQFSEQLTLEKDSDQICQSLLAELNPCIAAEAIAIELFGDEEVERSPQFFVNGSSEFHDQLIAIADYSVAKTKLNSRSDHQPEIRLVIANTPDEHAPQVVRCIVVPIHRDNSELGRMIAIRKLDENEFGTVEADLMKSTSMMLAVHLINQRQYYEMQQMCEGTIQSLVSALDAKDAYTCGHSSRVADLAVDLAKRLEFDDAGIRRIRMAGILHDIGKIGVEDSVLRKPGRLTDDEFEQIKLHPVLGFDILQGIRQFREILPAVRHHHEAWDGTGYPDGLCGTAIPRDAQVLAVADAFDAMTSDRPYRRGMEIDKVVSIFRKGRGTQWASDVVDALLGSPEIMAEYAESH